MATVFQLLLPTNVHIWSDLKSDAIDLAFPLSCQFFPKPESRQLSPGVGVLKSAEDIFPVPASLQGRLKTHLPCALQPTTPYSLDLSS